MYNRYMIVGESLNGVCNGKTFSINSTHPNYTKLVAALNNDDWKTFERNMDIPAAITRASNGKVTIVGDQVLYGGEVIHNVVTNRILDFMAKGLPFKPLMRFLDNLMQNPSMASRNECYDFLEACGLFITSDGCFLAYKGVRKDFRDIHSGKFDNSVGQIHEMERRDVDDDRRRDCSYGFHVGAESYATNFGGGGNVMLVKVNPRDVVAVPQDYSCQKCRVCKYEVVDLAKSLDLLTRDYDTEVDDDDDYDDYDDDLDDDDEDEDYCDQCNGPCRL